MFLSSQQYFSVSRSLGCKPLQLLFFFSQPIFNLSFYSSICHIFFPSPHQRTSDQLVGFVCAKPSPGSEAGRTWRSQTCGSTPAHTFGLWAVHVILASHIVYSLLPGPHRVSEKPQRKSTRAGDCCFSCLVTFLFLREIYGAQLTAPGRPLTWFRVWALIGDRWCFIVAGPLETTRKGERWEALFRLV